MKKQKISYIRLFVFLLIFLVFLFFRVFELKERAYVSVDQVNNAWAAYRIIVEHKFPLEGMAAKMSSITIGPLYYYYIAIFYWLTDLDLMASPIAAVATSVINFAMLYLVTRKFFGTTTALVASGINAVSWYFIGSDRGQVPINFIPSIGLLLFYCLHEVLGGKGKMIPWLGVVLGLSFHIHFTSVFYPVIIALTLPWWPNVKANRRYYTSAAVILAAFFSPMIAQSVIDKRPLWQASASYIGSSTHGFHLRRVLQLSHDAFIEFESIVMFRLFRPFVFFVLPFFFYVYNILSKRRDARIVLLLALWIVVPWIGFSLYSGEITNYYFSVGRYIILMVISYLLLWLWKKHVIGKILLSVLGIYFLFVNTREFFRASRGNLIDIEKEVKLKAQYHLDMPFVEGDPKPYLYTIYTRKSK